MVTDSSIDGKRPRNRPDQTIVNNQGFLHILQRELFLKREGDSDEITVLQDWHLWFLNRVHHFCPIF